RQRARDLAPALPERREHLVRASQAGGGPRPPELAAQREQKVLLHRQGREHRPPFGCLGDALARETVGPLLADVLAVEQVLPGRGPDQARAHPRDRGLTGPVRSEQGEHRSLPHRERDAEQRAERAVSRLDVTQLEQRLVVGRRGGRAHTSSPRYALRTASSSMTSAVGPDAITTPKSRTYSRDANACTISTSCSTRRMAVPRSRCTTCSVPTRSIVSLWSSPDDGSSRRSSNGSVISARPSSTRRARPRLNDSIGTSATSSNPSKSRVSWARRCSLALGLARFRMSFHSRPVPRRDRSATSR